MIYPGTDPRAWSLKHNLELSTDKCRKCGKEVEVNIPIISPDFVGFESAVHECGPQYRIILLKPTIPVEGF
jgi:hypothetical protein